MVSLRYQGWPGYMYSSSRVFDSSDPTHVNSPSSPCRAARPSKMHASKWNSCSMQGCIRARAAGRGACTARGDRTYAWCVMPSMAPRGAGTTDNNKSKSENKSESRKSRAATTTTNESQVRWAHCTSRQARCRASHRRRPTPVAGRRASRVHGRRLYPR